VVAEMGRCHERVAVSSELTEDSGAGQSSDCRSVGEKIAYFQGLGGPSHASIADAETMKSSQVTKCEASLQLSCICKFQTRVDRMK
jgi:hypothetical protein